MSANIETMFSADRIKPWHGLGTLIQDAPTSADALRLAGLDWKVIQKKLVTEDGIKIPGRLGNFRETDNAFLGDVSDRYKIVQNVEAFAFTDSLIGGDVHYETAGSLDNGKTIWMLAKMPECKIAGDVTEPYLCFSNSHNGKGAVNVCMTPIRVVCQNTLNIALNGAERKWSFSHVGKIEEKIQEARICLEMADRYMYELDEEANRLANITVTLDDMNDYLAELFPIDDSDSDRKKQNIQESRDGFIACFLAPDLMQFANTAWAAVNAASDFATHAKPHRMTKTFRENNWGRVMNGHELIDNTLKLVTAGKS